MKTGLRVIGAFFLGAAVAVWLVLPGLRSLGSPAPMAPTAPSLIAIAGNDDFIAVRSQVRMMNADPSATGPSRVYFQLSLGTSLASAGPTPKEEFRTVAAHGKGASAPTLSQSPSAFGATIVLLGPAASGITHCDDPQVIIQRKVSFSHLTDTERSAVVSYLGGENTIASNQAAPQNPSSKPYQTPGDRAYGISYTTLQPKVFYPGTEHPVTIDDGAGRTSAFNDYFNYFTCDFSRGTFWTVSSEGLTFRYPEENLVSASEDKSAVVQLIRTIQTVSTPNSHLLSVEGTSTLLPGGITQISNGSVVWDNALGQVSLPSVTATYSDDAVNSNRELLIFLGGIGLAIDAGLAASIIKTAVVAFVPCIVRRMKARRPIVE